MLAGRIIPSINFIEVETPNKDRSSKFKKSEKVKKIEKFDRVIFFRSSSLKKVFFILLKENSNDYSDS